MPITQQMFIATKFRLRNRDRRLMLHKICHFQPFLKFLLSIKFSWGPHFAKMPKMTDFSCLGNQLPRCVGSVVCNILAPFLNCLIGAFIPGRFQ